MNIWFWSDTHFNHQGILKYTTRGYAGVRQMNEWMVERWNTRVQPRDTIYLLGDFAFAPGADGQPLEEIFGRLHGHKHLVVGNHDERNPKVLRLPWESVSDLRTVKDEGRSAVVCHYPLETWAACWRGRLMLHGHCHGTLKRSVPRRFDVGVDADGWQGPLSFESLWARGQAQHFVPQDGHGGRDL